MSNNLIKMKYKLFDIENAVIMEIASSTLCTNTVIKVNKCFCSIQKVFDIGYKIIFF